MEELGQLMGTPVTAKSVSVTMNNFHVGLKVVKRDKERLVLSRKALKNNIYLFPRKHEEKLTPLHPLAS